MRDWKPVVCRKEIFTLLLWKLLLVLSANLVLMNRSAWFENSSTVGNFLTASIVVAFIVAPLFGWLADVKVGRYKLIIFGALVAFTANIVFSFGLYVLNEILSCIAAAIMCIGSVCFSAALLPFTRALSTHRASSITQYNTSYPHKQFRSSLRVSGHSNKEDLLRKESR